MTSQEEQAFNASVPGFDLDPSLIPRPSALPASGAWRPGDPLGERQFVRFAVDRPFVLEGGAQLRDLTLAFETWGTLNA